MWPLILSNPEKLVDFKDVKKAFVQPCRRDAMIADDFGINSNDASSVEEEYGSDDDSTSYGSVASFGSNLGDASSSSSSSNEPTPPAPPAKRARFNTYEGVLPCVSTHQPTQIFWLLREHAASIFGEE